MQETQVRSQGQEDPQEKEMSRHSSTLAWRIPRIEEPDGLQTMDRKELNMTMWLSFTFSGNWTPHAATKSLFATTKDTMKMEDPACCD